MGETGRWRASALVAGSFLAALVALAPGPEARAGCEGHGVMWDSDLRQTLALLSASMLDPAGRSDLGPRPPSAPAPCSGPSCSGRSGLPPASGTVRSLPPIERWADAGAFARPPAEDGRPLLAPDQPARPAASTSPPLRPPRPSAGA